MLALEEPWAIQQAINGGLIELTSNIPAGTGMGSSSSDVVAAISAVANCMKATLSSSDIATLAVAAERATDPIMYHDTVTLFAHREGKILESFGKSLPPIVVVGIDLQPDLTVNTLENIVSEHTSRELIHFEALRSSFRRAIEVKDPLLLGQVATASAGLINDSFLRGSLMNCCKSA